MGQCNLAGNHNEYAKITDLNLFCTDILNGVQEHRPDAIGEGNKRQTYRAMETP